MQKHYLLLRNNQQSGPFTIDELLQQHLTSSDLVWVEDQSSAWAFPYEIEELRFAAAGAAAAQRGQRHIYVSYPARPVAWMDKRPSNATRQEPSKFAENSGSKLTAQNLEQKAEELRKRALSWRPAERYHQAEEDTAEHVGYSSYERPIHFEFHRKKQYVTLEHLMVVLLISVMGAAAWYRGWIPLRSKMNTTEQTISPLISVDNHSAKGNTKLNANTQAPAQNNQQPALMLPATDTSANVSVALTDKPAAETIKKKKPAAKVLPKIAIKPEITQPLKEELMIPPSTPAANADDKKDVAATNVKQNTDESAEKKKEHRGFLGGLFKKKKKEESSGTGQTENKE